MHIYKEIYEFAASAGAFEGYVYSRDGWNPEDLTNWVENLVKAYNTIPKEAREEFQASLDHTLGRALHSLLNVVDTQHELVNKLKEMIKDPGPKSYDDFNKQKHFKDDR